MGVSLYTYVFWGYPLTNEYREALTPIDEHADIDIYDFDKAWAWERFGEDYYDLTDDEKDQMSVVVRPSLTYDEHTGAFVAPEELIWSEYWSEVPIPPNLDHKVKTRHMRDLEEYMDLLNLDLYIPDDRGRGWYSTMLYGV